MDPPLNAHQVAAVLLQFGANANDHGKTGDLEAPLHWAAGVCRVDMVNVMFDGGAELDPVGGCIANGTPLFLATCAARPRAGLKIQGRSWSRYWGSGLSD